MDERLLLMEEGHDHVHRQEAEEHERHGHQRAEQAAAEAGE